MESKELLKNQTLNFRFNPFGGINQSELIHTIVPKTYLEEIVEKIVAEEKCIIQLLGKKGRGKTTHLLYLQAHFDQYPLISLSNKNNKIVVEQYQDQIIFVDSIHHLSFRKRIQLFKTAQQIILTTHHHRLLEYKLAKVPYYSFRFVGLSKKGLKDMLEKRIAFALMDNTTLKFNDDYLAWLLATYKDDIRGIMNYLYTQFKLTGYE